MDKNKIVEQSPLSELQLELLQMGFQLEDIKQQLKVTKDKQKIIQNLLAEKQFQEKKQVNQNDLMDLKEQKNQSAMKDENEQDDFESVQQDYKMIFLARMDIKMPLGKMAAQVATAALAAFKQIEAKSDTDQLSQIAYYQWLQSGQKKIVVKVNSQAQLLALEQKIRKEQVNIFVNRTKKQDQLEIPEGTITVAAVGPATEDILDKLTGHLKLY